MLTSQWYPPLKPCPKAQELYDRCFKPFNVTGGWHVVLMDGDKPIAAGMLEYLRAGVGSISHVCTAPEYRRQKNADGIIKLLIFRAGLLGMTLVEAQADGDASAALLRSIPFSTTDGINFTKEVCDGCCENCKDKRACAEE